MNPPAIELYRSKGVDIAKEYLEIALCAQHNNGGVAVDSDWQTEVKGLFAVGECAGTHGITRPGGSALNAGQVGALRAASYISDNTEKQITYRCCHETYPYGAPGFPEPHFDLEFYAVLPWVTEEL
jgi:succinate dehydrogenase/fumarate reductase flavoprotein subunit